LQKSIKQARIHLLGESELNIDTEDTGRERAETNSEGQNTILNSLKCLIAKPKVFRLILRNTENRANCYVRRSLTLTQEGLPSSPVMRIVAEIGTSVLRYKQSLILGKGQFSGYSGY
jgi:hypothetical protein